jgi:hypothetical protein
MAVLSYNKLYQIQGWAKWRLGGEVRSVSVVDTPEGQDVVVVVKRGEVYSLEKFDEGSDVFSDLHNTDNPVPYDSVMVSNRFETQLETGTTIGKQKKISKVVLRLLDSEGFRAGYNGLETYRESVEEGDVMIRIGGGYDKELKMEVRSIDDKPLTVLAMVYGLEVG